MSNSFFTDKEKEILYAGILAPYTELEQDTFIAFCERSGLDPFRKQVYALPRTGKMTIVCGVDGFRAIAQRTGQYRGQTPKQWMDHQNAWHDVWVAKGANPLAARAGVYREGFSEPLMGVASWAENSGAGPMWRDMPAHMIGIRAECMALRAAFPEALSGVYAPEEIEHARDEQDSGVEVGRDDTPSNTADRVKAMMRDQGHDIVSGADVPNPPQPEPTTEETEQSETPPSSDEVVMDYDDINHWLLPSLDGLGKTVDQLRTAMKRAKGIDKDLIALPPEQWPKSWLPRIDRWFKKCLKEQEMDDEEKKAE